MRALGFLMLSAALAAGCSGESSDDGVTAETQQSLEVTSTELKASARSWTWVQHADTKTPKHLATSRLGPPLLVSGADVAATTIALLEENKTLFRFRKPDAELLASRVEVDSIGMRHARFQQLTHGVPVSGAELTAHYDKAGHLTSIDSNYVPDLDGLDVNPKLSADDARAVALAEVATRSGADEAALEPSSGSLVVYAPRGLKTPALAYEFTVRATSAATPSIWVVTVDAKEGHLLHAFDKLQTLAGRGKGVLGDEKDFEVTPAGNNYQLIDSSAAVKIDTRTATQTRNWPGKTLTSGNAFTWDENVDGAGSGVDAHFHAGIVATYYQERHARQGIDGKGGALISNVHFGVEYDNAAWDPQHHEMIYGDGGKVFYPPSVNLDVVGHEFTHGVTEATSALAYEGQPGALNEAVSDIFGAFIEHFQSPDDTKNWTIGEKALKAGGALRDMKDPGSVTLAQPAHMNEYVQTTQDNGGVHANSGIINNAAYLMTMGGTNPSSGMKVAKGIGWEKSERLWYRANTKYFMSTTDFGQAAHGLLQAARDVELSDDEMDAVGQALVATGIVDEDELQNIAAELPKSSRRKRLVITPGTCGASGLPASNGGALALVFVALAALTVERRRRS